ncbi:ankyrin repeat domain-containing protein [uncultured Brachyspira sp.]|uniref:ankyrin repeat domain-containing protein n=1 Tax=uncultured Brachyspira sp. TaxID=221953 RepID=UPI0026130E23|nr:ankyrin repeat domain-containing protein [uncultured Brachyspira sp.]
MKKIILLLTLIISSIPLYSQTERFTRLTPAQLTNLANPRRLSHRIFYRERSKGPNAKWFDAVKEGNLAEIKRMVEAGQDIEVQDTASLKQTALGWAAFIGYLDVVQYLVDKGANLYAGDTADVTSAFKSAILGGNIKVIEYLYPLYQGKLNLNEQDKRDGETMLMVAAGNSREDAVKFLLDKKVDVNIVSKQLNKSAFTYACESRNQNIIKMIKDAGGINVRTGKASCQ